MSTQVKTTQQDRDRRAQDDLTNRVGVRLERREKAERSPWSAIMRLLRRG